jgi:hypothetical protein
VGTLVNKEVLRMGIRLVAGMLAAVAVCAALAVGATAGGDSAKSKVKITEGGPDRFAGTVTSGEDKCEKRRKVSLEYKFGGPYKRGLVLDTTRTNADGKWSIDGAFQAGLYRAVVKEADKGDLTCRFDRTVFRQF